ncbi:MAG: VOC family protein [Antricoccus sp.]
MPSLQHPVIGVDDIERASTFWRSLPDYVSDLAYASPRWRTLRSATGVGSPLALMNSVTPPRTQPRHHLDLAVHGGPEQSAAEALVVELGGSRVDWQDFPDDPDFIVVADSEGNRFCLVDIDHVDRRVQSPGGREAVALPDPGQKAGLPIGSPDPGYYTDDGTPTFDAVRDRIQQQIGRVSGNAVLDIESERAVTEQTDRDRLEQAGRERLEQLRRSLQEPS